MVCGKHMKRIKSGDSQGFNLIELLIAMVILSVGLLGTAALITGIIKANQASKHVTIATTLANDKVEYWASTPYSELPSVSGTTTEDFGSMDDFLSYKRLSRIRVNNPGTDMKRIDVSVYWRTGTNPVTMSTIVER